MIGVLAFVLGPVVAALGMSFTEWQMGFSPTWIGLRNYVVELNEPLFWTSLKNTAYYTVGAIPLGMLVSLLLALALNQPIRFRTVYRTIFFMPVVTSVVAVALVWAWLYNPDFGIINSLLGAIGIQGPGWLTSLKWAMPSVIFMSVWHSMGYNMVILLSGLQGIPEHLYDAAKIDGANRWQEFLNVTLPMLSPTTFFILIVSVIGSFQVFGQVYMMTRGGPANATHVLVLRIFNLAFRFFRMGQAAALAWILFVIIMALTLVQFRYSRWVYYE
jgi:multiple sugar transport system permease protein